MLRLVMFVVDLFLLLPWWGALGVLAAIAIGFWALGRYIVYRLWRDVTGAIKEQGKPLADAHVTVHSVEPSEPPSGASPLDDFHDGEDDEDEDSDLDGEFATDGFVYFWIDATIAPQAAQASWDPSALTLIPADFQAQEEFEFCLKTALLHTLEVWRDGQFEPQGAGNVAGTQRLRMLFAVPQEVRQAKFTYHFTEFGRLALPARLELARCK
jgi:hypothetical protein